MKAFNQRIAAEARKAAVESFYHLTDCSLAGKCCRGTACFVARHLNLARWRQAESQDTAIHCLGQCFTAPACADENQRPSVKVCSREAVVLSRLQHGATRLLAQYRDAGGYRTLELALKLTPEQIIDAVEASGLRGRGGAGFPTGRKWRSVHGRSSEVKYVIANADEGDAGAYIDRYLLEDDPFALLEGMTIAAHAVGARKGWIYLRAEYPAARPILEAAIAEAREAGLLGSNILGSGLCFDLEVFVGKGSYLCGEETALIRSLEGRRPEVMARPPYPTEQGLFGQPTVINNVETLCTIPWIVGHGGAAYHAMGFSRSRGTKVISLNSLFEQPGLYEVDFGIPVRRIVEDYGGGLRDGARVKGVIIGGPLAGIIPPALLDTPFAFEELRAIGAGIGHGGVIAFDDHTSIAELIHHVCAFAADESCGKCTPCRLGSRRLELRFADPTPPPRSRDCPTTAELAELLKQASLCGHGIGLGEFLESAMRHYGEELKPWLP